MKIYRAVNFEPNFDNEAQQLLKGNMIFIKVNASEIRPGGNTFDQNSIANGKFFFINFMDAVKFCEYQHQHKYVYTHYKIIEFEVSDEILNENKGIGYYDSEESEYFYAPELLVPVEKLSSYLGDGRVFNENGIPAFKLSSDIKVYDNNSNEYSKALEYSKNNIFDKAYSELVFKILKLIGYEDIEYIQPFTKQAKESNSKEVYSIYKYINNEISNNIMAKKKQSI